MLFEYSYIKSEKFGLNPYTTNAEYFLLAHFVGQKSFVRQKLLDIHRTSCSSLTAEMASRPNMLSIQSACALSQLCCAVKMNVQRFITVN